MGGLGNAAYRKLGTRRWRRWRDGRMQHGEIQLGVGRLHGGMLENHPHLERRDDDPAKKHQVNPDRQSCRHDDDDQGEAHETAATP